MYLALPRTAAAVLKKKKTAAAKKNRNRHKTGNGTKTSFPNRKLLLLQRVLT